MLRVNTNVLDSHAEDLETLGKEMENVLQDLSECWFSLRRQQSVFEREAWAVRRQIERIVREEKSLRELGTTLKNISRAYENTERQLKHPKELTHELTHTDGIYGTANIDWTRTIPWLPWLGPGAILKPAFVIPLWQWIIWTDRRPRPVRPRLIIPPRVLWPKIWPPRPPRPIWGRYNYYRPGRRNIIWRYWMRKWFPFKFRYIRKKGLLPRGPELKIGPVDLSSRTISFVSVSDVNAEFDAVLKPMLKGEQR